MNMNLSDQDRADMARFLRDAIKADRYPFSPKMRRLKELLAKIDPAPAPVVTPYPAPKRSELLEKKKWGRSEPGKGKRNLK
jgi:hypothetical protein